MNYVVVLMVAVALFAVGYWYAAGRYYYIGPRTKAQLILGVEGEGKSRGLGDMSDGSSDEKRTTELSGESKPTSELPSDGRRPEMAGEDYRKELQ